MSKQAYLFLAERKIPEGALFLVEIEKGYNFECVNYLLELFPALPFHIRRVLCENANNDPKIVEKELKPFIG